jgi:hypothetical protein
MCIGSILGEGVIPKFEGGVYFYCIFNAQMFGKGVESGADPPPPMYKYGTEQRPIFGNLREVDHLRPSKTTSSIKS